MRERSSPGVWPSRRHFDDCDGRAAGNSAHGDAVAFPDEQMEEVADDWPVGIWVHVSFPFVC